MLASITALLAVWCPASLADDPPLPQATIAVEGGDEFFNDMMCVIDLAEAASPRLKDGGTYNLKEVKENLKGTGGSTSAYYEFEGSTLKGHLWFNPKQIKQSFWEESAFSGGSDQAPEPDKDAYWCGILTAVYLHEVVHEGIQDDLRECLDDPDAEVEEQCGEALAKLRCAKALHDLHDHLLSEFETEELARDGLVEDLEQLESELDQLQSQNPPDTQAITAKEAQIEAKEEAIADANAELAELEKQAQGVQSVLDGELAWLNQETEEGPPKKHKGEEALETCPAECVTPPVFPVQDPSTLADPITG